VVADLPAIDKIPINTATFKEVLSIVYLDYKTTKLIFSYKDSVGNIEKLQELKKIDGFPVEKYDRIALYLRAN
jgi:DNA uptake protein ComE-like DNA-binding protein